MADLLAALGALDTHTLLLINRSLQNPLFDILMPILSAKQYALVPAAAAVLALLVRRGRRAWVPLAAILLAVAVSDLGASLLKDLFQRVRPCHAVPDIRLLVGCTRSFSLPSNHASNMFALAGAGWITLGRWRWALAALAAAVATSRVYLGVHYPLDVLAGAALGAGVGLGSALLVRRILRRWVDAGPEKAAEPPEPA